MKRTPPPRHAQIHLPPMEAERAYFVVKILDRIVEAIWRAHGEAMADFQGRVFPDEPPPDDAVTQRDNFSDEDDIHF